MLVTMSSAGLPLTCKVALSSVSVCVPQRLEPAATRSKVSSRRSVAPGRSTIGVLPTEATPPIASVPKTSYPLVAIAPRTSSVLLRLTSVWPV